MKVSIIFLVSLVFGLSSFAQVDMEEEKPELKRTQYDLVYIPDGFDSNDQVEIVGEGFFPNTCWRAAPPSVYVDHQRKEITLYAHAYKYSGPCLQMIVPFNQTVNLGILKKAKYKIINAEKKVFGVVNVRQSKNKGPDDHLYAPVSQAFVEEVDSKYFLKVVGVFTKSCHVLDYVKVSVKDQVIVAQPITEYKDFSPCENGQFPFHTMVELPTDLVAGRYLLHVRSLNGKSLNSLVDIRPILEDD